MSRESVDLVRRDQACVGPDVSRLRRRSPCFCDGLEDNAQSSVYREWLARAVRPVDSGARWDLNPDRVSRFARPRHDGEFGVGLVTLGIAAVTSSASAARPALPGHRWWGVQHPRQRGATQLASGLSVEQQLGQLLVAGFNGSRAPRHTRSALRSGRLSAPGGRFAASG